MKTGTLDRNRTCDLKLRRLPLYPTELPGHTSILSNSKHQIPPRSAVAVSPAHGKNTNNTLAIRLRACAPKPLRRRRREGEKESQIPNLKG